ncbi:hypothetical protein TSOC_000331 [Tetrabaena socialis]|uniref:Uncharacterized protein n=1 Tax=Tetrabaena socialis TaxID=47790 RepID=A0A2J8AJF6_9CHLO|nr:hypothetical protein TSOC_000331 [Tetrabaena socialis]|eukprot:PNH12657.1 hypothetical protein TSOC_000331 [Tetrabaena socialis]
METAIKRVNGGLPASRLALGPRTAAAAVQQRVAGPSVTMRAGPSEEIYIGFVKEEGFGSREGRQGRTIKDDPRKYPSRDAWGTGGWAGGEAGLWQLREETKKSKVKIAPKTAPRSNLPPPAKTPPGKDLIYVGFVKEEGFGSREGRRGRVLIDDPRKYPGKEDIGPLSGVAGGFAGGEAGIKQFVATGDLKLRKPGDPGPKQFSPLTLAGLVALAGAVGGVVLDLVSDAGENAVSRDLLQAPIDDNTKTLLLAALGLLGASGLIVGASTAIRSISEVSEKLVASAKNAAVIAVFIAVVFLVAKGILEDGA